MNVFNYLTVHLLNFLIQSVVSSETGAHNRRHEILKWLHNPLYRVKRYAGESVDTCDKSCVSTMQTNMEYYVPEFERITDFQNDAFSMSTLTHNELYTFCNNVYKPFDNCLGKCAESKRKRILEIILKPTAFMCGDHFNDFYNSRNCVRSVKPETIFTCDANICTVQKKLVEANKSQKPIQDDKIEKQFLAANCRLIRCLAQCELQILQHKCGRNTSSLQKTYINLYLSRLRREYNELGLTSAWPDECNVKF